MTAEEWASVICSRLESASYLTPRGKQSRHSDVVQLVRIRAPSVDCVLDSVQELADTDQLSRRRRENSSDSSACVKNSQSTVS